MNRRTAESVRGLTPALRLCAVIVFTLFAGFPLRAVAAGASIEGVVRTSSGVELTGATVAVRPAGAASAMAIILTSDEHGAFRVLDLPSGSYRVSVTLGDRTFSSRVEVSASECAQIDVTLEATDEPRPDEPGPWAAKAARGIASLGFETSLIRSGEFGFSEMLVWRPHAKLTSSHAVYRIGVDLLANNPTDEPTLASARLGVDVALGPKGVADVEIAAGPQLDERGLWSTANLGAGWRKNHFELFATETRFGLTTTSLFNTNIGDQWLAEASIGGRVLFECECISFRVWLGGELWVPLAHSGGPLPSVGKGVLAGSDALLDPTSRLELKLGIAVDAISDWDVFAELAVRDHGERDVPGTTLPILIGGSDQAEIVLG